MNEKIRKKIASLLALIKIRAEDFDYSCDGLVELFNKYDSSTHVHSLYITPDSFFNAIERSLTVPITEADRAILLAEYLEKSSNKIHLLAFLTDIGLKFNSSIMESAYQVFEEAVELAPPSYFDSTNVEIVNENKILVEPSIQPVDVLDRSLDTKFFEDLEELKNKYADLQHSTGPALTTTKKYQNFLSPVVSPLSKLGSSTFPGDSNLRSSIIRNERCPETTSTASTPLHSSTRFEEFGEKKRPSNVPNKYLVSILPNTSKQDQLSPNWKNPITFNDNSINLPIQGHTSAALRLSESEQSLLQQLLKLPNPLGACKELIHKIRRVSTNGSESRLQHAHATLTCYISCSELADIFVSIGLKLSCADVECLAAGFSSNGDDGICAKEVCQAIDEISYHLIQVTRKNKEKNFNSPVPDQPVDLAIQSFLMPIYDQLCEDFLNIHSTEIFSNTTVNGSQNVYWQSPGASSLAQSTLLEARMTCIQKLIVRPFLSHDPSKKGTISKYSFINTMTSIFPTSSASSLLTIADTFKSTDSNLTSSHNSGAKLFESSPTHCNGDTWSTLGSNNSSIHPPARLSQNPTDISHATSPQHHLNIESAESSVKYRSCLRQLFSYFKKILCDHNRVLRYTESITSDKILRPNNELRTMFELIHHLVTQLECLSPSSRRSRLISLHRRIVCNEMFHQVPSNDTQAARAALSASQRRPYSSSHDIDGFQFVDILMDVGFDLSRDDRMRILTFVEKKPVSGKLEYRHLCQLLLRSYHCDWSIDEKEVSFKIIKAMGATVPSRIQWLRSLKIELKSNELSRQNTSYGDELVNPAFFLRCLRKHEVTLSINEEALLLDCMELDTIAFMKSAKPGYRREFDQLENREYELYIPAISYRSFLLFCSRFIGHWSDLCPEQLKKLSKSMSTNEHVLEHIRELDRLFKSLDEHGCCEVTERSFAIVAHRSQLMHDLSEDDISVIKKALLSASDSGAIVYKLFIHHIESTYHQLSIVLHAKPEVSELFLSLIRSVEADTGSLSRLRKWLILRHSETLFQSDINEMFYHFGVKLSQAQLELIWSHLMHNRISIHSITPGIHSLDRITCARLMETLMSHRRIWSRSHPDITKKIVSFLSLTSDDDQVTDSTFDRNLKLIISRLLLFSNDDISSGGNIPPEVPTHKTFISNDIFQSVLQVCGLVLTDNDVHILADYTDVSPNANSVNCQIFLDAKDWVDSRRSSSGTKRFQLSANNNEEETYRDTLIYFVDVMTRESKKWKRTLLDWIIDIEALCRGFDVDNHGVLSVDGFSTCMQIVGIDLPPVKLENLKRINDGLIAYKEIFSSILDFISDESGYNNRKLLKPQNERSLRKSIDTNQQISNISNYSSKQQNVKERQESMPASVLALIRAVSRYIFKQIRVSPSTNQRCDDSTWAALISPFKRFSRNGYGDEWVSGRDFCLAVSILLGNDEVVLSNDDWAEIIEYLMISGHFSPHAVTGVRVDYIRFCQMVSHAVRLLEADHPIKQDTKYSSASKVTPSRSRHTRSVPAVTPDPRPTNLYSEQHKVESRDAYVPEVQSSDQFTNRPLRTPTSTGTQRLSSMSSRTNSPSVGPESSPQAKAQTNTRFFKPTLRISVDVASPKNLSNNSPFLSAFPSTHNVHQSRAISSSRDARRSQNIIEPSPLIRGKTMVRDGDSMSPCVSAANSSNNHRDRALNRTQRILAARSTSRTSPRNNVNIDGSSPRSLPDSRNDAYQPPSHFNRSRNNSRPTSNNRNPTIIEPSTLTTSGRHGRPSTTNSTTSAPTANAVTATRSLRDVKLSVQRILTQDTKNISLDAERSKRLREYICKSFDDHERASLCLIRYEILDALQSYIYQASRRSDSVFLAFEEVLSSIPWRKGDSGYIRREEFLTCLCEIGIDDRALFHTSEDRMTLDTLEHLGKKNSWDREIRMDVRDVKCMIFDVNLLDIM